MLADKVAYWINERESVRRRKEAGKDKPWFDDPVFHHTYFCNVHREDDRVTRWLANHWRRHYPHPNYELAIVLFRLINWPDTLEVLGFPFEWSASSYLERLRAIEGKKWGNAYVITTHGKKMPKDQFVMDMLDDIAPLLYEIRDMDECRRVHEYLQGFDGLGSFLSAQVIADLKNTSGHPLQTAIDRFSFCAHGPGSLRGLSWALGEKVTPRYFHAAIRELYAETIPLVHPDNLPIDLQDFQNVMCEFDKYMRVSNGTGRSKRRYSGV